MPAPCSNYAITTPNQPNRLMVSHATQCAQIYRTNSRTRILLLLKSYEERGENRATIKGLACRHIGARRYRTASGALPDQAGRRTTHPERRARRCAACPAPTRSLAREPQTSSACRLALAALPARAVWYPWARCRPHPCHGDHRLDARQAQFQLVPRLIHLAQIVVAAALARYKMLAAHAENITTTAAATRVPMPDHVLEGRSTARADVVHCAHKRHRSWPGGVELIKDDVDSLPQLSGLGFHGAFSAP